MKNNEKKIVFCNLEKMYFLYCSFLGAPLASHFDNDFRAREGTPIYLYKIIGVHTCLIR